MVLLPYVFLEVQLMWQRKKPASLVELGKSEIVNDGYNIAIIAVGNMFEEVEKAYNLLMKENIIQQL